jgi:hypothetical protein
MAEGPVVHHYARKLKEVLQGREVRIEFGLKKLKPLEPSVEKIRVLKGLRKNNFSICRV